jgi:HB1, ASXL, restriction endonuclease HTH domain
LLAPVLTRSLDVSEALRVALDANRAAIEAGLDEAERELAELQERERELQALIARGRATLGEQLDGAPASDEPRTLHEAIKLVLEEAGNRWMTVRELAEAVNRRGLYRKRDGSSVEANQIHARTRNYEAMFEKDGPRIRLRAPA